MNARLSLIPILAFALLGCQQAGSSEEPHAGHAPAPSPPAHEPHAPAPGLALDERSAAMANVAVAPARLQPFQTRILASGRVTYDEARLARVTAWVEGRVDRLVVATTGAVVEKGRPIAEIYSPELVSTQQELLVATRSARALADSSVPGVAEDARRLADAARQRLRLWGLSDAQIEAVVRRGQPLTVVPILAPASGVVIRRMVQAGDWVDRGMTLLEIADLSRVWVEADVYEYELGGLELGQNAEIETMAHPGEPFSGRVSFIEPVLRAETRTNTVRIVLDNRHGRLKPDMTVTAAILVDQGERLVVPKDAVLDTGKRTVVWVKNAAGRFESRDVTVGARSADRVAIAAGLEAGEQVAVSGGFMIDASSQLSRTGGAHRGHGAEGGGRD
ncbi:MAG: efflux RND transporter periplasmic adaptor subunit [Candidatus Sericytochromatia bacterium]